MVLNTLLLFSFLFAPKQSIPASIYDFKVVGLNGGTIDFSQFKGKKILIVNTASKCKFTEQYDELQKLYLKYSPNLIIVGFPANNFLFEEPGSNSKIAEFCKVNYGVTFPMAAKISVRGSHIAPIYSWLTRKEYNGYKDSKVKWNFQKYLIDEKGRLINIFGPSTTPNSPEVIEAIEQATD